MLYCKLSDIDLIGVHPGMDNPTITRTTASVVTSLNQHHPEISLDSHAFIMLNLDQELNCSIKTHLSSHTIIDIINDTTVKDTSDLIIHQLEHNWFHIVVITWDDVDDVSFTIYLHPKCSLMG